MISLSGRLLGNNDMANYIKRIKLTILKAGILTFQLSSDVLFKFQIDSTWSQGSSLKYNREWISATIRVFRFFKIFLVTWRANCKRERETAQTGHEEFLPTDKENGCRKLAFNPKSGQLKIKWDFFWNCSLLFGGIRFVCVLNTRVIIVDSVEENTLERKEML